MFDISTGAWRPVNDDARADRQTAAAALVQATLARHGLTSPLGGASSPTAPDLTALLQRSLPIGNGLTVPGRSSPVPVPEGAQFLSATHQTPGGSRAYRTYVPASASAGSAGMVMMLHGCTQTPEDFAIGTGMNALAEKHRFIVVYPEQSRGANAQTCWNWFSPQDQVHGRGEPQILAGIAQQVMSAHATPADRGFVAGLSAGAAMAVILGQTYPDAFAAVGAHSGLPYRAARDVPSAFAAMSGTTPRGTVQASGPGVRTIVFHGTSDTTVVPSNGAAIADDAARRGPPQSIQTERLGEANGRTYSVTTETGPDGRDHLESWSVEGLGHAWSGGQPGGSYADPRGPDASAAMIRFFFQNGD